MLGKSLEEMAVIFGDQIDAGQVLATHGDLHLPRTVVQEAKIVEEKNEYE